MGLDVRKNSDKFSTSLEGRSETDGEDERLQTRFRWRRKLRTLITDIKIVNKAKRTCINMNQNNRNYFNIDITGILMVLQIFYYILLLLTNISTILSQRSLTSRT